MNKQLIDVLLVEDDKDMAQSIAEYLLGDDIRCDHAFNGHAGLELANQHNYGVILLDWMLPRKDGVAVCEQLRQVGNDTPILMLTAKDSLDDKVAGFAAGVDDYLVKPFAMKELVMRIKALAKRRSSQARSLKIADLVLDLDACTVQRAGVEIKLTPTSFAILELLMRNSPAAVKRGDIEAALWPDEMPMSNNLKVHLYQLRQKVDKPFDVKLIETVVNHGFRIAGESCDA